MSNLNNLKEVADRNLGGLKADTRLLHQILNAKTQKTKKRINWRPIAVVSSAAVVLLVAASIALPQLMRYDGDINVVTKSAGGELEDGIVEFSANVPAGSVNINESTKNIPGYHTLFAAGQSANFPLVKIGNATYRMLTDAVTVSSGLLGSQLGSVTDYTSEPAVSTGSIVSNTVAAGQAVYAVQGMESAMIAAEVNGALRAFQRVSYSGAAIIGAETLKDVLTGDISVVSMELSGVGRISDNATVQELMDVLYSYANYEGAAVRTSYNQSLLLTLANGLSVQLNIGNESVSACGTWSCPEFFDAFTNAIN